MDVSTLLPSCSITEIHYLKAYGNYKLKFLKLIRNDNGPFFKKINKEQ